MSGDAANTERAHAVWEAVASIQGGWDPADSLVLGPYAGYQYRHDPKHLCFVLSRYKFAAKMLAGKERVFEMGCGDAFGTPLVAQSVGHVIAFDWDERLVAGNTDRLSFVKNCAFRRHDAVADPITGGPFDAGFSLDVIEHIDPSREDAFMRHCVDALTPAGTLLIGTPNVTASAYASPSSQVGHINLKSAPTFRQLMARYFESVFIFSMNDEVVHSGFYDMAHYLFALGVGARDRRPGA